MAIYFTIFATFEILGLKIESSFSSLFKEFSYCHFKPSTRSLRLKVVDRHCPKGHLCLYYPYLLPVGKLININDPYVGRSQWSVRRSSSFEVPITYQRLFNVFDQILIFSTFFDISDRKPAFLTFWTKKPSFSKFLTKHRIFRQKSKFLTNNQFLLTFSFTKKQFFLIKKPNLL